jgi:small-conductance mechanosensitive channel
MERIDMENLNILLCEIVFFGAIFRLIGALIVLAIGGVVLYYAKGILLSRKGIDSNQRFISNLIMLSLVIIVGIFVLLALPLNGQTKTELLKLVSVLLMGVIALSSTTFISNLMAGFMLRAINNFRLGDFIEVEGEHFGRVTEIDLFHTEIQTKDRDLLTLPNLFLITHPVKVIHASGTMIGCEISLGYDISRAVIEPLLLEAAANSNLQDAYVHIESLGDFSVIYRVAGFLGEVTTLISVQAKLRANVLDTLHKANVEIISPSFMNQRRISADEKVIPETTEREDFSAINEANVEEVVFDKAHEAAQIEVFRNERDTLIEQIKKLKEKGADQSVEAKGDSKKEIETLKEKKEDIDEKIDDAS